MLERLFRGKRRDNDNWIIGYYLVVGGISYILPEGCFLQQIVEVYSSTVGQYTGRPDKNGVKIFDGDILACKEWSHGEYCWVGTVNYERGFYFVSGGPNEECETGFHLQLSRFGEDWMKIIGNIHDTPELL